jgi:catalase (peroxidase I)
MKWSQACQDDGKIVYKSDSDPNIIMLPSDIALLTDEKMVPWVELYATDEARFFADFSVAFTKLQELGVPAFHSATPYNY